MNNTKEDILFQNDGKTCQPQQTNDFSGFRVHVPLYGHSWCHMLIGILVWVGFRVRLAENTTKQPEWHFSCKRNIRNKTNKMSLTVNMGVYGIPFTVKLILLH